MNEKKRRRMERALVRRERDIKANARLLEMDLNEFSKRNSERRIRAAKADVDALKRKLGVAA